MIEINLVPDVKRDLLKAQRIRSTVISFSVFLGIGFSVIVAILSAYTFGVQTVRGTILDEAINKGSSELASVEDLSKTLTIQNQLTKISALHANKSITSRVFDVLIEIIPPAPNNVKISNLFVDTATGSVVIEGQASKAYAAVEVFKKTIQGAKVQYSIDDIDGEVDLASNISTGETSYGEESSGNKVLRFTLSFDYAPELFSPASENVVIKISTQGNATDSYLGVPKSIFVDRAKDLEVEQ